MRRLRGSMRWSASIPRLLLFGCVLLYSIPGILSSRIVSLGSIVIFTTHEWLPMKPIVYFHCQGENKGGKEINLVSPPLLLIAIAASFLPPPDPSPSSFLIHFALIIMWRPRGSRRCSTSIPCLLLIGCVLLYSIPGILSSRIVSLGSIVIFTTHEWLPMKPIVYFHCQGENKTVLPDVKEKDILYTFRGEESWQPLTQLPEKKCKRCGFYEQDTFKADDVFDEWELCAGNFVDGKYVRKKNKEFNATFICPRCTASDGVDETLESKDEASGRRGKMVTVIIICVFAASFVMVAGIVALYKYWQKRKREQDQARFLKLFDEGDDIEDELGLGYII